jgi:hypothetical protein
VQTVFFVAKIHFAPAPIFPRVNITKKGAITRNFRFWSPYRNSNCRLFAWSRDGEEKKLCNRRHRHCSRPCH